MCYCLLYLVQLSMPFWDVMNSLVSNMCITNIYPWVWLPSTRITPTLICYLSIRRLISLGKVWQLLYIQCPNLLVPSRQWKTMLTCAINLGPMPRTNCFSLTVVYLSTVTISFINYIRLAAAGFDYKKFNEHSFRIGHFCSCSSGTRPYDSGRWKSTATLGIQNH